MRGHLSWLASKVITRIISLRSFLLGSQRRQFNHAATLPKFGRNRRWFQQKTCNIAEWDTTGPRLLFMTYSKSHTRFRFVPQSTTLDDLERPLRTLFQNACIFGAHQENLNEHRPTPSAAKM